MELTFATPALLFPAVSLALWIVEVSISVQALELQLGDLGVLDHRRISDILGA